MTHVMPAGETWTLDDDEMRRLRRRMAETERLLAQQRDHLNTMIKARRLTLRMFDQHVVCPVCGVVTDLHVGSVAPHESELGGQCRGTGIGWAARHDEHGGL